jgi:hypothetical protein
MSQYLLLQPAGGGPVTVLEGQLLKTERLATGEAGIDANPGPSYPLGMEIRTGLRDAPRFGEKYRAVIVESAVGRPEVAGISAPVYTVTSATYSFETGVSGNSSVVHLVRERF